MRFEIPQFIDIEDKLFGPFTFRQFIYLAGGAGIVYTLFRFLPLPFAVLFGVPIAGFSLALVFYKPNKRPFIKMVESFVRYATHKRFYLWHHASSKAVKQTQQTAQQVVTPREASERKLQDLAWSLDILDTNTQ